MPLELSVKIVIIVSLIITQAFLFSYKINMGLFIIAGILTFLFIFSSKDRALKKREENNLLKKHDWFISNNKLPKEIP